MTDPQHEETFADTERKLREIITTLRAQLTEARAELVRRVDMHECAMAERDDATLYSDEQRARADRTEQRVATLEAALAAQIEADAGIITSRRAEMDAVGDALPSAVDRAVFREIVSLLNVVATAIRNQPRAGAAEHGSYDRTALDRHDAKTREKALREAADACDWGDIYGDNAVRTILALIDKEKSNDLP